MTTTREHDRAAGLLVKQSQRVIKVNVSLVCEIKTTSVNKRCTQTTTEKKENIYIA